MLSEEEMTRSQFDAEQSDMPEMKSKPQKEQAEEEQRCDFCGKLFSETKASLGGSERRKYCSKSCQSRASQGRIKARLAAPPSKRYAARLKYSNPLYFN
jgi:hypothetical protein